MDHHQHSVNGHMKGGEMNGEGGLLLLKPLLAIHLSMGISLLWLMLRMSLVEWMHENGE